ncbi:MAG: B12-binding domain-containing protein [Candidatus Methylomirabilia bacterium]
MNFSKLAEHIVAGDAKAAEQWTNQALSSGANPVDLINNGLMPGMAVVGEKFKNCEYYLPEVLVSARAMKKSMELVRPLLTDRQAPDMGRVAIGTVKGDLHDIGKNVVAMMLEGAGFRVHNLGADVPPDSFIQAVQAYDCSLVCLSALLTTTMPMMRITIEALEGAEVRHRVKVMVGGAPVTQDYATGIGADGYARDGASAVDKAKELVGIPAK